MLADHPTYTILLSKDLDASRTFYHDVLGLEILREDLGEGVEEPIVFKTANGRLILSKSTVGTSDTQTQMAWVVPDIRAAIEDLRSRGVRIGRVPLRPPDRAQQDGIGAPAGRQRVIAQWAAELVDRGSADQLLVVAEAAQGVENAPRGGHDLGTDAVPGEDDDVRILVCLAHRFAAPYRLRSALRIGSRGPANRFRSGTSDIHWREECGRST